MIKLEHIKVLLLILFMIVAISCEKESEKTQTESFPSILYDDISVKSFMGKSYSQTFYESGELKSYMLKYPDNQEFFSIEYAKDGTIIWNGFYMNGNRTYYDSIDFQKEEFYLYPSYDTLYTDDTVYFKIINDYYHPEELSFIASIAYFNYDKEYNSFQLIPIDTGYVRIVVQSWIDYGDWKIIDSIFVTNNKNMSGNASNELSE